VNAQSARPSAESGILPSFDDQREYWDERWSRTPTPNGWSIRRGETIIAWLRALELENPRILDYGCGTGWFTAELAKVGTAVGIDLSEAAIAAARRRYPGATFVAANLFELDAPQNTFDIVVSQEVIAHVTDQRDYIERITRMLKPNGFLVLTTANKVVMDRLVHPPDPPAHIKRWTGWREIQHLLQHRYRVLKRTTVVPRGNRGFLRIVNSAKLNVALELIFSPPQIERFKERAGWGYTLLVLAQLIRP
jgi:2-polyprenyl-3-methyl-5-hydroxy-6-metoxy-1,4-benzoquinol methylase